MAQSDPPAAGVYPAYMRVVDKPAIVREGGDACVKEYRGRHQGSMSLWRVASSAEVAGTLAAMIGTTKVVPNKRGVVLIAAAELERVIVPVHSPERATPGQPKEVAERHYHFEPAEHHMAALARLFPGPASGTVWSGYVPRACWTTIWRRWQRDGMIPVEYAIQVQEHLDACAAVPDLAC